jgi:cytoskeletal protein CcmA (bactofilin family)
MAMFGKDGTQKPEGRSPGSPVEAVLSIVAAGMTITGDVQTAGVLKVDGEINGSIIGARQVLLGRGGVVRGNVAAAEVVVGGSVEGAVSAIERLELQSTASVHGDIDTRSIVVIEGAKINGTVRMADTAVIKAEPLRIARG